MRSYRVLVGILALLPCICLADDSAQQVQPFTHPNFDQNLGLRLDPDGKIFGRGPRALPKGEFKIINPNSAVRTRTNKKRNLAADDTCYTMRSYVVERDDPASDAVRPKGYSTCQPSSRFDLKNAVAPADAPKTNDSSDPEH
jgi:hypothetical protein